MTAAFHAHCDKPHCTGKTAEGVTRGRLILATAIVASGLGFLDGSIINVTLPALSKALGGGAMDLQWTVNGYLLPAAALLLLGGAAGDRLGRRKLLIAGIVTFALASLGCALARDFAWLVGLRVVQGIGAAMMMPNSLGLLGAAFSGPARGRAIGIWSAAGVGASAVGPPLGGWLVDAAGWPFVFLINLPIAALALGLALRLDPDDAEAEGTLDWPGAAVATLALALTTWSLTLFSSRQAMAPARWIELVAGLGLFALFLHLEHRRGERAMMPLTMFGALRFAGLTLMTFLIYGALGGLFILLPYVLIQGGYTALQAGLALLPFPAIVGLVSARVGAFAGRHGPRWPLTLGCGLAAAGFALFARVEPGGSYWAGIVPGAAILALGMAGAITPLATAVVASVDARHVGTASGLNSTVSRAGTLIATALSGAVLSQKGAALTAGFHAAVWIGAGLCLAAAMTAALTLRGEMAEAGPRNISDGVAP